MFAYGNLDPGGNVIVSMGFIVGDGHRLDLRCQDGFYQTLDAQKVFVGYSDWPACRLPECEMPEDVEGVVNRLHKDSDIFYLLCEYGKKVG